MDRAEERTRSGRDRDRTQRAAVRVGLWVGLSSAAIVGLIAAITVAVVVLASRPSTRPGREDGEGRPFEDRVVDLDRILPLVIALAVLGVIALALIAWYVSRRATAPLAEALRLQRAFVSDASHELRTPLTTLNSRIQLAQHRLDRGGDVASVLGQLRADASTLDGVLTDLLLAAESAGSRPPGSSRASVAEAITSAVATVEPLAQRRGVVIGADAPADAAAAADQVALERALVALLDNAVHHSPDGARVEVTATVHGRSIQLRVIDQGPGIRDVDPDRVFDRFARGDGGGDRRRFGLGLALVRDIAHRFSGSIRVEQTSPAGTTFLLVLPTAPGL